MSQTIKYQIRTVAGIVLAVGVLAGCVTSNDLLEVRQIAEQARTDAAAAQRVANEANATANQSMQMSRDTDERVNRLFQRSMLK